MKDPQDAVGDIYKLPFIDEDVLTPEHDEKVLGVLNKAIELATKYYQDPHNPDKNVTELKILFYALDKLIIPLREQSPENGQNYIFRDADHYLAGRLQEWQSSLGIVSRGENPKKSLSFIGPVASGTYNHLFKKLGLVHLGAMIAGRPTPSPAGGGHWAQAGQNDFEKDPDMTQNRTPDKITAMPSAAELKYQENVAQARIDIARYGPGW